MRRGTGPRAGVREAIVAAVITMVLAGCAGSSNSTPDPAGSYRLSGIMRATHLEGGCWQFLADNGQTYDLQGNDIDPLLHDGLRAEILVRDASGQSSICMTGKIVVVLRIISTSH